MVTCHTHRAMTVPFWATVFQGDILQRTDNHTFATADALLGGTIFFVVCSVFVETPIDHIAFQPSRTAYDHVGKAFPIQDPWDITTHDDFGCFDLFTGFFLGVELEAGHTDVGLGHLHTEASRKLPAFFSDGLAENLLGVAAFIATGAGKIHIFGLNVLVEFMDDFKYQMWRRPGIDGKHKPQTFTID